MSAVLCREVCFLCEFPAIVISSPAAPLKHWLLAITSKVVATAAPHPCCTSYWLTLPRTTLQIFHIKHLGKQKLFINDLMLLCHGQNQEQLFAGLSIRPLLGWFSLDSLECYC